MAASPLRAAAGPGSAPPNPLATAGAAAFVRAAQHARNPGHLALTRPAKWAKVPPGLT